MFSSMGDDCVFSQGDLSELQTNQWSHENVVATDNLLTLISFLVGVASLLKGNMVFLRKREMGTFFVRNCCLSPFCRWLAHFVPLAVYHCFVPPRSHTSSSVCTAPLTPSGIPEPRVCILISCNFPICLQFLNNPSVSMTDEVCFLPLSLLVHLLGLCLCVFLFMSAPFTYYPLRYRKCPWPDNLKGAEALLLNTLARMSLPVFREVENRASV